MNAPMKLAGFSTSNKVMNHCPNILPTIFANLCPRYNLNGDIVVSKIMAYRMNPHIGYKLLFLFWYLMKKCLCNI